ncbi:MAG: calcium/sodium antiporter [Saprospiraceae bacterium]|nr:calcium/sodium antiporter [Saprospiraceae bacterium]
MIYFLLLLGFFLLIKGADWLVDGATAIAARFGVSDLIIGLTIVSMGTSLPELIISVIASIDGSSGLVTGNVLGSNIANVLLILGITAIICDLPVHRNTILSELPFSLAAALLVGFLANSALGPDLETELSISRIDGLLIFFFFFLFMVYIVLITREDQQKSQDTEAVSVAPAPMQKSLLLILAGVICLFLGGKWVVEGAVHLAGLFGMSQTLVGLTVVAIGTSLPELVTSVLAARKKNTDIAVGNAIGSNIFNLLWILGISAVIRPIPFSVASNVDILVVVASTCMIFLALIISRRFEIKRGAGLVFLLAYVSYLAFVVVRG